MDERLPPKAAENWDLHAVVRRFSSAVDTAGTTTTNFAQEISTADENSRSENPLSFMATMSFEEDDDPFLFPNLMQTRKNGFEELQDSFKPFFPILSSSSHVPGGLTGPNQQQQQQLTASTSITPPATTTSSPLFVFGEPKSQETPHVHHDLQQQPQIQQQQPLISSVLPVRPMPSQASRSRKRKAPQKRMVCHVTAENLSADMWAWRKYGQKPIKGSPYPRNYYRCSSSKACAARKQVERSNADPNIYVVSYTGDHTHPRPTHRNSLAGSTRNKFSKAQNSTNSSSELKVTTAPQYQSGDDASSSYPLLAASQSTTAPLVLTEEDKNSIDKASEERGSKCFGEEEDDLDDLLILNLAAAIDEDFFKGLKDFVTTAASGGSGGG